MPEAADLNHHAVHALQSGNGTLQRGEFESLDINLEKIDCVTFRVIQGIQPSYLAYLSSGLACTGIVFQVVFAKAVQAAGGLLTFLHLNHQFFIIRTERHRVDYPAKSACLLEPLQPSHMGSQRLKERDLRLRISRLESQREVPVVGADIVNDRACGQPPIECFNQELIVGLPVEWCQPYELFWNERQAPGMQSPKGGNGLQIS